MIGPIQKAREAAVHKASEAVKPLCEEIAKSRLTLSAARRAITDLNAQRTKLWNETYSKALKEPETP